jgi:hypothetical protein
MQETRPMHLSSDARVNALFVNPDVEVGEDELDHLAGVLETEAEERAQAEIDEWYAERERREAAPDSWLDSMYEAAHE